ncbi:MAG: CBS domain-containing protein [Candidatus Aureabacteria bacterium]|nr:CBS domain-containing protein [Candidatus Auribacterota bacterium]
MKLITTHLNADFDAFASLIAASKLYPDAKILLPSSLDPNVETFLSTCSDSLDIPLAPEVKAEDIKQVILVDSAPGSRIGDVYNWIISGKIPLIIYDHHKIKKKERNAKHYYFPFGSTVTGLCLEIIRKKIKLNMTEATAMLLGIYEDTGHFSYLSTTPEDFRAAAFLVSSGADISMVHSFLGSELDSAQTMLLKELISGSEEFILGSFHINMASASINEHVTNLGLVVHRLRDVENINAIFALIEMDNRIHIVARSNVSVVNVARILEKLGGGGHPTAASVTLKKVMLVEAKEKLKKAITEELSLPVKAGDIMQRYVKKVSRQSTVEKAKELMVRNSMDEIPVVQMGRFIGFLSRHDADKVILHGLKNSRVADYMTPEDRTVSEKCTIPEIKDYMFKSRHSVIPVVDGKSRLAGLILKNDLLKILHEQDSGYYLPVEAGMAPSLSDIRTGIENVLSPDVKAVLHEAGRIADEMKCNAYIVGGIVRDILLKAPNYDVDIVIEDKGIEFASRLAKKLGGYSVTHKKFLTSIVALPSGMKIDVATARTEYYEKPGALPKIEYSSIRSDLYRRDFTINAMAVRINEKGFGQLIDFFGGRKDLRDKVIRVLHNLSFVDDPTRIFRAVRFEQRLGFRIDKHTQNLIKNAVDMKMFDKVAYDRVKNEIILMLNEPKPLNAIKRMAAFNELRFIHPSIKFDRRAANIFSKTEEALAWFSFSLNKRAPFTQWVIYFMGLIDPLSVSETMAVCDRFKLSKKSKEKILRFKREGGSKIRYLSQKKKLLNSEIYFNLIIYSVEFLLFLLAKADEDEAKRRIIGFIEKLRNTKLNITGRTLIGRGIAPSPYFRDILRKTLEAKLDGKLGTKEEELQYVLKLLKEL